MATKAHFNAKSPTIKRILREASELQSSPSPDYTAVPIDDNLFEWHFTLRGPPGNTDGGAEGGPYHDGIYHGRIVLPAEYPLRPPSFRFLTPSGRFEANREICLSISGHHEETWQPAWGLRTALVALRTFMETDAKGQLGGIECSDAIRRRMAKESRNWKCTSCGKTNYEILKECEEAAASTSSESKPDVEVPKELRMDWKDELERKKKEAEQEINDVESAALAEGFVQTVPLESVQPPPVQQSLVGTQYPAARPAQGVPQPTRTIPLQAQAGQPAAAVRQLQRQSNAGVPAWVDKAIVGLAACLVVMILKVLLGL